MQKKAYKQIEEMLKQYGLTNDDIYLDRNSKSFISAETFILTVIAGKKTYETLPKVENNFHG